MAVNYKKEPRPPEVRERPEEKQHGCTLRVQKAKERVLSTMPSVDLERAKIVTESFMQTEVDPMVVRQAKAFREQCQRKTIFIQDDELIIGSQGSRIRAGNLSPNINWQLLENELDTISTRPQDPFLITEDQKRLLREFIKPYWEGKSVCEAWLAKEPEDIHQLEDAGILFSNGQTWSGVNQYSAGYDWLINSGISGIRKRIEGKLDSLDVATPGHYKGIIFLNALLIVCDGIDTLAKRYAQLTREKADEEKDPQRKAELEKMAEICQWVPTNPARTFWEALQSLWFYHTCMLMQQNNLSLAPGRVDQYLYPYYKKDIEEGRLTKEQAQELLECLWVKFAETCNLLSELDAKYFAGYIPYQHMCCGGLTKGGQDATNELSYMMVQATMDLRMNQPTFSIKYNKKNPDSLLHKVAELVALGTGHPAIFNDEVGIKTTLDKGAPLEEAYNWNPAGCMGPQLMGKVRYLVEVADINLGGAIELALLNGVHRLTKRRLPVPETGDPREFKSFEEFKTAVKTQFAYLIRKAVEAGQMIDVIVRDRRPLPVVSLGYEECIDNARDIEHGGAKYDWGLTFLIAGIADLVNSLAAVKKLIYDDKKLTWDELLEALDNDFEGYEEIRQMCLSVPKYGNDIQEVDEIATEIFEFITEEFRKYRGQFGGKMQIHSAAASVHIPHGSFVGALPTGRKSRQPLSDGVSPMQGTDTKGPTAILKSVSKINHTLFTGGTILNMRLDPSVFKDEKGISSFMNLIKSMCDLGVSHDQFNVVSSETLRAAQKYPEKYHGLVVRVAGYSAYFEELSKEVQDDIISRTVLAI